MDVLKEYFVRLGFQPDNRSLARFQGTLALAEKSVSASVSGMAGQVTKATLGVFGSLTTISGAIVGLVENVAKADQSYRLLALHQLMTVESATKLSLITKTLGATLEEIRWDPELGARAAFLARDIHDVWQSLGMDNPQYKSAMLGWRNIGYEFDRLKLLADGLSKGFAVSLFDKLFPGGSADERIVKFDKWVTDFKDSIPQIAGQLADIAVPILKTTWGLVTSLGDALGAGALMFTNLVGVLSGDSSIQSSELSFTNLALAIEHVVNGMKWIVDHVTEAERAVSKVARKVGLGVDPLGPNPAGLGNLPKNKPADSPMTTRELELSGAAGLAGLYLFRKPIFALGRGAKSIWTAINNIGRTSTSWEGIGSASRTVAEATETVAKTSASEEAAWARLAGGFGESATAAGTEIATAAETAANAAAAGITVAGTGIATALGLLAAPLAVGGAGYLFGKYIAPRMDIKHDPNEWMKPEQKSAAAQNLTHGSSSPKESLSSMMFGMDTAALLAPPSGTGVAVPSSTGATVPNDTLAAIHAAIIKHPNVPTSLALAVIEQESGFRTNSVSPKGAMGPMQLMAGTAKDLGVDRTNPSENIEGGVLYLSQLLKQYGGDTAKALAAYNAGPGRVDSGKPLPAETEAYVPSVLQRQQKYAEFDVPSGAHGLEVPASVSSMLAILHPREWTLPAPITAGFRRLFSSPALDLHQQYRTPDVVSHASHRYIRMGDIDLGGVNITQPGASIGEIKQEIVRTIRAELQDQITEDLLQIAEAW